MAAASDHVSQEFDMFDRRFFAGLGIAAAAAIATTPAHGQWNATAYGAAEWDTNETMLLLAGITAGPGGLGLSPVVSLQGHHLRFDTGTGNASVWTIRPAVGLSNGFNGGFAQFMVGYAFQFGGTPAPAGTVVPTPDTEDGVVLTGLLDFWGTGGPLGAQLIASYNAGAEALWTRGRLTTRLQQPAAGGEVRVGGEVAYLNTPGLNAVQPGGVLSWRSPGGLILAAGAGVKLIDGADNPTHVKVEFSLPVLR
jgi:hypothetical protein